MCLGYPARVIKLNKEEATVEFNGKKYKVDVSLIENLDINDYVMVHKGIAIHKLDESDAIAVIEIVKNCTHHIDKE